MPQASQQAMPGGIAMSEELRDEHFNQKISEAFDLKNKGRNQEALEIYLHVLSQDFLKVILF